MGKKTVRLEMNSAGFQAILKSPGVVADIEKRTNAIAAAAGPGMEPSVRVGVTRVRGSVITADYDAMKAEATNKALTSAIDAGRG